MHWPDFHEIGLAGNLAAFGLASALVWLAGDRLARCSQVIADCTKLGQAFIGTVLLGVTVSLPEMTLAAVAAALGNAALAVNSLLGGIASRWSCWQSRIWRSARSRFRSTCSTRWCCCKARW